MKSIVKRIVAAHGVGCALLLTANSYAQGQSDLLIQVMVDGQVWEVPIEFTQEGKLTFWNFTGQLLLGNEVDGAILTGLNGSANPDPFLGYAIGITDIGASSTFGFVFGTPIVALSPPGTVTSSFSASLTDGPGAGGLGVGAKSITPGVPGVPVDGDGIAEVHVVNDGHPLTNDGLDLGPASGVLGGGASVHGPFNEVGPLPGPGPWTWLQIDVNFTGSGGGDFYGLTGSAEKVETTRVPEAASTLFLTLVGLASCGLSRRFGLFSR
jgi:hypothetical protein